MADGQSTALAVSHSPTPPAEISFEQMERMADSFAKSNLFGVKTKDAALSLLMIAQAEGIHPALAVMEYDIIEGKPARKAERLLARFQMSGGRVEWLSYTDENVTARFTHPLGSDVTVDWTMEKARKVSYYAKGSNGEQGRWKPLADKYNWKNWPRAMLRSRCIAEGVRACFPGASLVTLTSEEAQDLGEPLEARIVDHSGDADQRPASERASEVLIGKPARDLFDDFARQMSEVDNEEALDAIWEEASASTISRAKRDTLAEHCERVRIALKEGEAIPEAPQFEEPPEPSPFEALNAEGDKVADAAGLAVWRGKLTPETLGNCTEDERAKLKATHAAAKERVTKSAGAGGRPSEDAGNAEESGGAANSAGAEAPPASSSPFEKLKAEGEAILKLEGKRRRSNHLAAWREAIEAAKYDISDIEAADLKALEAEVAGKAAS